jgi:hypothetical protein
VIHQKTLAKNIQTPVSRKRPDEARTHLHGRWLVFVRILCILLVTYTLGFFGTGLVLAFAEHQAICTGLTCALPIPEALISFAVAALIFWRKSNDWMALLVALMLVLLAPISTLPNAIFDLLGSVPVMNVLLLVSGYLAFASILLFWFLFPNGRFVPRWTLWLVAGYLLWFASLFIEPSSEPDALFSLNIVALLCLLLIVVFVQVYRYREVSNPLERQQTKWAIVGTSIAVWGGFISLFFWNFSITRALLLLIPFSIGIAVLRYRLYEIDVLINRTLVYGTLTGILALVYFGLVFVLQFLVRGLISQTNSVAIVVSTLAVAALFHPLRHRIQAIIDRRFYRRKYDAAKIIEAFSATLRAETDLARLSEQLVAVVQETMQPSHVSLWVRPPEHDGKQQAPWRANPPVSSEGR